MFSAQHCVTVFCKELINVNSFIDPVNTRINFFYIWFLLIKPELQMKRMKLSVSIVLLLLMPLWLTAQEEKIDLAMMYKIKQEGLKNSNIEELAFWLTDYRGTKAYRFPGGSRGNEWAKKNVWKNLVSRM
jgi:hypothetical protein